MKCSGFTLYRLSIGKTSAVLFVFIIPRLSPPCNDYFLHGQDLPGLNPACYSERQRRIFLFRADAHSLHLPPRGRETPAAIRFPFIAHLRQICGFAGLFIVLSIISGTPLSSLVRRKLQRSTRRRGEKNLPALRSTPLRAEIILFRSPAAAQDADLPCFY